MNDINTVKSGLVGIISSYFAKVPSVILGFVTAYLDNKLLAFSAQNAGLNPEDSLLVELTINTYRSTDTDGWSGVEIDIKVAILDKNGKCVEMLISDQKNKSLNFLVAINLTQKMKRSFKSMKNSRTQNIQ